MTDAVTRNSKKKLDSNTRRRNIRNRLLAAIVELAASGEPYSTVSVERLATTAALSRATFYIYFEGKADLLEAWFDDVETELGEATAAWFSLDGPASQAELGRVLQGVAEIYRSHHGLLTAFYDEATQNAELRARLTGAIAGVTKDLQVHLEAGQHGGWVDADLLPAETAAWIVWMLERGLGNVVAGRESAEAELLVANLTSMIWHVLYVGSPARPA